MAKNITCKNCLYWEEFKLIPGKKISDLSLRDKGNFNARKGDCRNDKSLKAITYSSSTCEFSERRTNV